MHPRTVSQNASSQLSWGDWLLRGAAAGVLAGIVIGVIARLWPGLGLAWGAGATVLGLVAAVGLVGAAGAPGPSGRRARAVVVAAAALLAASVIYVVQGRRFELFGLVVLGGGLGVALATAARAGARRYVIIGAAALTPLVIFGLRALAEARLFGGAMPPFVAGGLQLGIAGTALALPALAALFAPREDALERRAADARRRAAFDTEVAPLVERVLSLRATLRTALSGDAPVSGAAAGTAARSAATGPAELLARVDAIASETLLLGERHHALAAEARAGLDTLEGRADDLRRRAAATTDAVAASEYIRAATMVAEQSKHAEALRGAADRIVARLCGFVATLERVQLGLASAHGGAAEQAAWDLAPALDALKTRATELELEAAGAAEAGMME